MAQKQEKQPSAAERLTGDKRESILEAALSRFGRYGYRRTSMEEIARDAEIAKGTIYLYFSSKDELFAALTERLVDQAMANARKAAALDSPFVDRMIGVLDAKVGAFYRWVLSSPHVQELIDEKSRLSQQTFTEFDQAYRALMTGIVEDAARQGEIDLAVAGLSAEDVTDTLLAAAHGAESGSPSSDQHAARLARIVRLAVLGLDARPRSGATPG